jgi:uncharacterized protein (DUF934 family)
MPKIIKDSQVVNDDWLIVEGTETSIPEGVSLLLPFTLWQTHNDTLTHRNDIGVWFDSEEMPTTEHAEALNALPLIAIRFPVFTDGRGFSIARLLRERFNYTGELRAFGYVLRDQLCYMKRCGFNSFVLQEHANIEAAAESLRDFTEFYQTSVDQPIPLFRRQ